MKPFPLPLIARKAEQLGLPFLLIGGHAVNQYAEPRSTLDIDLLIRSQDRAAWSKLVTAEGFRLLHDGGSFLQFDPPYGTNWRLDFMLVNEATYQKLRAQAVEVSALGLTIGVPAAHHIIALKLHALAHGTLERREKDLLDVINILRAQKLSLDVEPMPEILERYGSRTIVDEIRRKLMAT